MHICGKCYRDPYGYDEPPPSYASYDRASSYARAAYDAPPITDRCAILGSCFWTPPLHYGQPSLVAGESAPCMDL